MLKPNDGIIKKILDINKCCLWIVRLFKNPTNVTVPKTSFGIMWIVFGIDKTVMKPMTENPPFD